MMGVRDYVLGLECGNCYPDGRAAMREKDMLYTHRINYDTVRVFFLIIKLILMWYRIGTGMF